MKKLFVCLTVAMGLVMGCASKTVHNDPTVQLVSYGIYKEEARKSSRPAGSDEMMVGDVYKEIDAVLLQPTDTIPSRMHVLFGIEYSIASPDKEVDVQVIHVHPEITSPDGKVYGNQTYRTRKETGKVHHALYEIEAPGEMVEGPWTIQVFVDGKKHVEKTFNLKKE